MIFFSFNQQFKVMTRLELLMKFLDLIMMAIVVPTNNQSYLVTLSVI
jgi:hypothetical protein